MSNKNEVVLNINSDEKVDLSAASYLKESNPDCNNFQLIHTLYNDTDDLLLKNITEVGKLMPGNKKVFGVGVYFWNFKEVKKLLERCNHLVIDFDEPLDMISIPMTESEDWVTSNGRPIILENMQATDKPNIITANGKLGKPMTRKQHLEWLNAKSKII